MKIFRHSFFRCKFSVIVFLVSLTLNLVLWLLLYFYVKPSDFPMPLHYSIYFGIDVIDFWYKAFVIPLIGIILMVLNIFLGFMFYRREKFIAYFLSVNNLLLQMVLLVAGVPVILMQNAL